MTTPTLRSRPQPPSDAQPQYPPAIPTRRTKTPEPGWQGRMTVIDILRLVGGMLFLSSTLSYLVTSESLIWNYKAPSTARIKAWLRGPIRLSPTELARYDGTDKSRPIYVALNGSIYDVSASPHLYGPGGGYAFFAGKDATRAFVTGCFAEDLTPDLRGVEDMFLPLEHDDDDGGENGGDGDGDEGARKLRRRERKLLRERERRVAKIKVREAVDGWRKMFDGGKNGAYFWVGTVVGAELGDLKPLCEKAQKARPKRGAGGKGE